MSLQALPILFINLGGEMMYILDQRLTAQNIAPEKASKVMNDVIGTMLNRAFVEELFKPQELFSKATLKMAFDKLAHASIMRLNANSMDKLYDLITMAFKYQTVMCPRPSDLLFITFNHLDALRRFVTSEPIVQQVNAVHQLFVKNYCQMGQGQFQLVRYTLLRFFQDIHIRVSVLLRDGSQNPNGRFVMATSGPVPIGTEVPGKIRIFNAGGDVAKVTNFPSGGMYCPAPKSGSYDVEGERVLKLGSNMYIVTCAQLPSAAAKNAESQNSSENKDQAAIHGKEEINFLALLLGSRKCVTENPEFKLQLFDLEESNDEETTQQIEQDTCISTVTCGASLMSDELVKIAGEMNITDKNHESSGDLLELMDSAI